MQNRNLKNIFLRKYTWHYNIILVSGVQPGDLTFIYLKMVNQTFNSYLDYLFLMYRNMIDFYIFVGQPY